MEQSRYCIGIAAAMSIIVMMVLPYNCLATDYTVGDSGGWNLQVDYTTWASSKTFAAGDNLVFIYSSPFHSVLEVSKAAHDSCSTSNALKSYTGGSSTVALDSAGAKYFICGTGGHCAQGMKLAVNVGTSRSPTITSPTSNNGTKTPPTTPTSAAVAASYMQIMDGVVLVGSLVVGALAVRML